MKKNIDIKNLIIAHRGIHDNDKVPENSLLAFKKAVNLSIPIELDVQLTKDNVLVVYHDRNLKRLTNINKDISDLSFDEIKNINLLNTNEKIPTLQQVLKLVDGKVFLDIELKPTKKVRIICKELYDTLKNYNGKYIVKSFDPRIVFYLRLHYPTIIRGLLLNNKNSKNNGNNMITNFLLIQLCKPDFLAVSKSLVNNKYFKKTMKKLPTLVWTINSKEDFNKIDAPVVGYICNNLPF